MGDKEQTKKEQTKKEEIAKVDYDLTTGGGAASLLALYSEESGSNEYVTELDPRDLLPVMRLPRDGREFKVTIGKDGESVEGYKANKFITVVPVGMVGQRALWHADDSINQPVCSTGLTSVEKLRLDESIGKWNGEDLDQTPSPRSCAGCEWNEFGSIREWANKDSNAKACNEQRMFFLMPVDRIGAVPGSDEPLGLYDIKVDDRLSDRAINPSGIIQFPFSYGSNHEVVKKMVKACHVRKIPFWASVWKISCDRKTIGSYDVGFIVADFVGVIGPKGVIKTEGGELRIEHGVQSIKQHVTPWINDYVRMYGNKYSESDLSREDGVVKDSGSFNGEVNVPF